MTQAQFREIALSLPEAVEGSHMDHPDFRVGDKIFATLFPRDGKTWGMLKLKPDQQRQLVKINSESFAPIPGGWGKGGATQVSLAKAKAPAVKSAMIMAWRNTAPKALVAEHGLSEDDPPARRKRG